MDTEFRMLLQFTLNSQFSPIHLDTRGRMEVTRDRAD